MKLGILASHPIQYQAPLFKELARIWDVKVYFAHRATPEDQAAAGFGVSFEWDLDLLEGYTSQFLKNISKHPNTGTFWGCNTPEIEEHIRREKFDAFIVAGWNLFSYWQAVFACRRLHIPVCVRGDSQLNTPRSLRVLILKRFTYPLLLNMFDGFLVVGTRHREYLRHYGVPEHKMFCCPHFVDNDRFYRDSRMSEEEKANMKRALGLDKNLPTIIFVGKFIPKKRPMDLLLAAKELQAQGILIQVLLVGSGSLEPSLRSYAKQEGLKVVFAGFVNQRELPKYYGISDLLVLPSDGGETWGLVVNEAMACGTPAIVSDQVGCAPDMICKGLTGMVYTYGMALELAQSIKNMIRPKQEYQQVTWEVVHRHSVGVALEGIQKALFADLTSK